MDTVPHPNNRESTKESTSGCPRSPLIMRIDMSGETKSTSMDMACEEVIKKFSASPDVDRGMAFPLLSMTDRCAFCYGPSLLRDSGFFLLEEAYAYPRS
ncbi:hypothetical protein Tco_0970669 [Tanacetum coccineum]